MSLFRPLPFADRESHSTMKASLRCAHGLGVLALLPGFCFSGCASKPDAPSPYAVETISSENVEIVSVDARPAWHGLTVTGKVLVRPGPEGLEYPPIEVSLLAPGGNVLEKFSTPFYPQLRPKRTKPQRAGFGVTFARNPPPDTSVRVSSRPTPQNTPVPMPPP